MQLFAYDTFDLPIFAIRAMKRVDYFCPECKGTLRLREGDMRRPHFYHVVSKTSCRQNGKSEAHLQTQLYFQKHLPEGEVFLEKRFQEIRRIADVAWINQKIVFEIQYSPLSRQEALSRIYDYQSIGYQTVFILSDIAFNKERVSPLEGALQGRKYYFTTIDRNARGGIFDQYHLIEHGIRTKKHSRLSVDLSRPLIDKKGNFSGFEGDFDSLDENDPYRKKILEKNKPSPKIREQRPSLFSRLLKRLDAWVYKRALPYCDGQGHDHVR